MDKKMKTNQDGGGKSSTAPANELKANQEGAAKYKGAHDYKKGAANKKPDANGNGVPDYAEDGVGAARMGYSQSFGAARMNGYAKGAAKVTNIMTNGGAARYMGKGAADKGHGRDDEAHTHKTSGSYALNVPFGKDASGKPFGGESVVGQTAANNLTITHDPEHKDLGALGRFSNQMYMAPVGGDSRQTPGDELVNVRIRGVSQGSVNRLGETNPGANFFPPKEEDKIKTSVVTASSKNPWDGDSDGDTAFLDSNQDGTMLGRGLMNAYKYFRSK